MKFRNAEKGMALVITLMMLAIVTFMSVIFLAMSRRERSSVKIVEEQNTSRMMADSGSARAQADIVSTMNRDADAFLFGKRPNGSTWTPNDREMIIRNGLLQRARLHYGLRPSRSYTRPGGFVPADGTNAYNVSYELSQGPNKWTAIPYGDPNYLQSVANMQYDARVPVWEDLGTKNPKLNFYLDLNRNGTFDDNYTHDIDFYDGQDNNVPNVRFSGDPEWIGVLERPDQPHSEVNRFVGRYAYLILPMGKSLDINFIHNVASGSEDPIRSTSKYSRNWGVGSWELNMAAFLVDFHKGVFNPRSTTVYDYDSTSATPFAAAGTAFRAARGILGYRLDETRANLYTPQEWFPQMQTQAALWTADYVDMQGDGPMVHYNDWFKERAPIAKKILSDDDLTARRWFGADYPAKTREYSDIQRPFTIPRGFNSDFATFYDAFIKATSSNSRTNYDRYGYYRWIAQMGADSVPALPGKIHLNYTNEPGTIATNLKSWVEATANVPGTPTLLERQDGSTLTNFFLITADAMLKRSLITNVFLDRFNRWQTNYTVGGPYFTDPNLNTRPDLQRQIANFPVRHDISITNIQIFHQPVANPTLAFSFVTNREYSSAVHRILQVAANIYDNMTNAGPEEPYLPSVFRPVFTVTATNVFISGYNFAPERSRLSFAPGSWLTEKELFALGQGIYTNLNLFGQAAVIGAKKGWPNFNELDVETFIQVGRKLEINKRSIGSDPSTWLTNQMFAIGISNRFGMEAWNSYSAELKRPIEIHAKLITELMMDATFNGVRRPVLTNVHVAEVNNYVVNTWKGRKEALGQLQTTPLIISTNANGDSDFRVPIYTNNVPLPFGTFDPLLPNFFRELYAAKPPERFTPTLELPDFQLHVTNRFYYVAIDTRYQRIVDYVSVENLKADLDIRQLMVGNVNAANDAFSSRGFRAAMSWDTNLVDKTKVAGPTVGITNQVAISMGQIKVSQQDWKDYNFQSADILLSTNKFEEFMRPWAEIQTPALKTKTTDQAPFAPVRKLYMRMFYQVNDPFVHYMAGDMQDPFLPHPGSTRKDTNRVQFLNPPNVPKKNDDLGIANSLYRPWGAVGDFTIADYRIYNSDDWTFPIAKLDDPNRPANVYGPGGFHYRFRNIGEIGRVHRGTPWQTIYLKAGYANTTNYANWAGSWGTHPTTDWKLIDLFTTAMSENATRGLLSVNQTNMAAWSAVLSGVQVVTNSVPDAEFRKTPFTTPRFGVKGPNGENGLDLIVQPGSAQLSNIVAGINRYRASRPLGVFGYMGEILGTPELSMGYWNNGLTASPYLNYLIYENGKAVSVNTNQLGRAFTDEALEAIPQRILSLLKADEPRMVIYAFGQTLKPAPRSLATSGNFYNLVQNYQVTGEYATKTVVRVEGELRNPSNPLRTVVESYEQLPPFE